MKEVAGHAPKERNSKGKSQQERCKCHRWHDTPPWGGGGGGRLLCVCIVVYV